MRKVFILAFGIAMASASSGLALAQSVGGPADYARGQAVNTCRDAYKGDMNDHYARLAIEACVERVLRGTPGAIY